MQRKEMRQRAFVRIIPQARQEKEGRRLIVRDIMTTKLMTVEPDDTLGHAAQILRRQTFHHLPVAKKMSKPGAQRKEDNHPTAPVLLFSGVLTTQDIEMAAAFASHESSSEALHRPWQEQRVLEVMRPAPICVTPQTAVGAAAQLLVERGLQYLPVVEYASSRAEPHLVGLLTRSDLLIALARVMGTFEPGMHLEVELSLGDLSPLAETLRIAREHQIQIRSVIAAPLRATLCVYWCRWMAPRWRSRPWSPLRNF